MARIVAISGIDCAGKSTQIALLRAALEKKAVPVEVLWFRPGYSSMLDRLRAWVRRVRPGALPTAAEPLARERVLRRPGVRRAWATIALFDSTLHYAIMVRWALLRGRLVLCDRYLEDGLLDLDLRFPELQIRTWFLARLLRVVTPRPTVAMLLSLPQEVMLVRMAAKGEPFPDPPETRERRLEAYVRWAAEGTVEVVDATRPVPDIHAELRSRVEQALFGART